MPILSQLEPHLRHLRCSATPSILVLRALTDTFAGIAPASAPGFVLAQMAAVGLALAAVRVLETPTR